jgi:hypothetical protein
MESNPEVMNNFLKELGTSRYILGLNTEKYAVQDLLSV